VTAQKHKSALNKPNGSVLSEFLGSAGRLQGGILGLLGVISSVIVWIIAPDTQIKVFWLWLVTAFLVIIIWLLIDVANRSLNRFVHYLPDVVTALPNNGLNVFPVIILDESELFGHQSLVTIYYVDDNNIELQVGSGHVSTIQTDRRIQIEVNHWAKAHESILASMKIASPDTLKRLLVKPTATYGNPSGDAFKYLLETDDTTDDQRNEDG